jgi:hypothetical protein
LSRKKEIHDDNKGVGNETRHNWEPEDWLNHVLDWGSNCVFGELAGHVVDIPDLEKFARGAV